MLLVLAPAARKDGSDYTWNVEAGVKDSVEHVVKEDVVRQIVELAASWNSRYDGWGTTV